MHLMHYCRHIREPLIVKIEWLTPRRLSICDDLQCGRSLIDGVSHDFVAIAVITILIDLFRNVSFNALPNL